VTETFRAPDASLGGVRPLIEQSLSRSVRHVAGLDGLRALSIAAVVAYHADVAQTPGGFIGVEVFFALSGYLIASSLMSELERHGRIDIGRYVTRRARRLVPALLAMLSVVTLAVVVGFPDEIDHLRRGLIGALTGSSNWVDIVAGTSYFSELGRGPVLRHLWSFAVEVQAYVVLPVLLWGLWRATGRHRRLTSATLAGLGALSYGWQALMAHGAIDSSRAYFGTDTRIGAVLLGAALAAWPRSQWRHRWVPELVGVGALMVLGYGVATIDGGDPSLYQGVMAAYCVAGVVAIWACGASQSMRTNWVLANPVLSWMGTRSYGIYLWHWPIFVLTRPIAGVAFSPVGLAWRLGVTALIAELSHRFVEARWLRPAEPMIKPQPSSRHWLPVGQLQMGASLGLVAALAVGVVTARPGRDEVSDRLNALGAQPSFGGGSAVRPAVLPALPLPVDGPTPTTAELGDDVPATVGASDVGTGTPSSIVSSDVDVSAQQSPVAGGEDPAPVASTPALVPTITLIGDSVMLAASDELKEAHQCSR
jgi:peptidoglycan/LPS O-acetylase OafA/YrhL